MKRWQLLGLVCGVGMLSACGGGGGGGGSGAAATSYPLLSAFNARIAAGFSKNFTVSGACTGTATLAETAAVGGQTFDSVAGRLKVTRTLSTSFTGCALVNLNETTEFYYDTSYVPLGFVTTSPGTLFGAFAATPNYPSSVVIGAIASPTTGTIGTINLFSDSSRVTAQGQQDYTYLITADTTASTAVVNQIASRIPAGGGGVTVTQTERYRVGATGAAELLSVRIQNVNSTSGVEVLLQ